MRYVEPSPVSGLVRAPHSKSVFQRAVAAACLAPGTSRLLARDLCRDDLAALGLASGLGAQVTQAPGAVEIRGGGRPSGERISCGESGLSLRLFSALASLFEKEIVLAGSGSLTRRPVGMVVAPLRELGAACTTAGGFPPVTVRGPIHGGRVTVDASTSSQFLTGLLLALPCCRSDSEVSAPGLKSRPYVELTLNLLRQFGIEVDAAPDLEFFRISGGQEYRPVELEVEGDWSGGAFLLVAGALGGPLEVAGLDPASVQADRAVLDALTAAGAELEITPAAIRVAPGSPRAFAFDATDCPDLFPPLTVLALALPGRSRIRGVSRLRHKESDRAAALVEEFSRIGSRIEVEDDMMYVTGGRVSGGQADARGDHRIAMALALAALRAEHPVGISGAESVSKSYPGFFADLEKMGAKVR